MWEDFPVLVPRRTGYPPDEVVSVWIDAIEPLGQAKQARRIRPAGWERKGLTQDQRIGPAKVDVLEVIRTGLRV